MLIIKKDKSQRRKKSETRYLEFNRLKDDGFFKRKQDFKNILKEKENFKSNEHVKIYDSYLVPWD